MQTNAVVISRHPAAIEFIRQEIKKEWQRRLPPSRCISVTIPDTENALLLWNDGTVAEWIVSQAPAPVLVAKVPIIRGNATPEDVRGKHVYGNVPLCLACEASIVYAIEFDGTPPRGTEYGIEEMRAAGAKLTAYTVRKAE